MQLESQGWKEVACRKWLALPPGAMMRSESKLLLRAMSRSVVMQWQGLVSSVSYYY